MKEKHRLIDIDHIIDEEQERLYKYACYRVGNIDDAADIVQDIFVKIYSKPSLFLSVDNIQAYLYRSIINACNSFHRIHIKNKFISIDEIGDLKEQENEDFKHEFIRISNILSTIPEEQAEVIRWRIICDKSFVDIAKILSLPVTTVKSRFNYGIDKIRKQFFKQNNESLL